ncbi:C-GCAxxG-C-C family protein [Pseudoflavonifractor phocaeensis]|uniref:C-GCAxxG-C-C family protein n=1 Tax=Pseudoflavonifractor phocaeensis TaxID=1870988 RepID=UPI00313C2601
MSEALEKAKALRADITAHYNCCQATLMPFHAACGIDEETARKAGAFFNSGMRCGSVCGAVTGALMALGMAGAGDKAGPELLRRFRDKNGTINCAELLKAAVERGEPRGEHCDRMVFEAVELAQELLDKKD